MVAVQSNNVAAVNEVLNEIYVEEEDSYYANQLICMSY
jgi:hypothetical protein